MSFLTLDFETYYSRDFSLSKLTTEEYIRDPRFQVIGVGVKQGDEPAEWFTGTHAEIREYLDKFDWANSALLCHNTLFDGGILSFLFGIVPAYYFDTLCMARALHGVDAGGSLKALVERYALGAKGTEVVDALGLRREDFPAEQLAQYGRYCCNDVELTFKLFNALAAQSFPQAELDLIDMTLRMYTQPVLMVDDALLTERLDEIRREKTEMLHALMARLLCDTPEAVRKKLASNLQFAQLLGEHGAEPPKKISPTTGKETWALAKNDEGFLALAEHEDPFIQQLCAVRLGTKSTIEESRIERFIGLGARNRGRLPIPLKYYGAHTGRWAGMDAVNFQNLPSRDKKKKALKNAIVAPPGHVVINCDSSQIEARVLAWLAGQHDVTQQFRDKEDVYSTFATKVYSRPISKDTPVERFVGKTCLGAGTRVLTRRGWVPILDVALTDQLWDGVEWVQHQGVSFMGLKPTIWLSGLELTTDHEILTAHTKWEIAQDVLTHEAAFQSALDLAISSLSGMGNTTPYERGSVGVGTRFAAALAAAVNTLMRGITLERGEQPRAMPAPSARQAKKDGGNTKQSYPTTPSAAVCSVDWPLPLRAATVETTITSAIMVEGVFTCLRSGEKIALPFLDIFRQYRAGTTPAGKWIASTIQKGMNRGISGSLRLKKTQTTKELSSSLRPVFDILNSGSRSRFTVLTDRGPVIVHNCVLGLGYGTGAAKLQHTLKTSPPGADLSLEECERIVGLYRETNYRIKQFWAQCEVALHAIMGGCSGDYFLDDRDALVITKGGIRLPNGLLIRYPELQNKDGKLAYASRHGMRSIWGGAVTENVVQALARIIVGEQMRALRARYRPVLTVHDAAVIVVPEEEVEQALAFITHVMSTPPDWATDLPVACEAKYGQSYGAC